MKFILNSGTKSLKSRCQQGWFLREALRENLFHTPLLASGAPWQSLAFLGFSTHHSSFCSHLHIAFFECLCVKYPLFSLKTPTTGFRFSPAGLTFATCVLGFFQCKYTHILKKKRERKMELYDPISLQYHALCTYTFPYN